MDLSVYHSFLAELAQASGDFVQPLFGRHDLAVDAKSDASPVTAADRGAEEIMRKLIRARFPGHGVIGEEYGSEHPDAEWVWVLDPIDGTKAFITGVPLWTTLIGLLHRGQPVLGAIHQPVLGQLAIGDGATCTLNGKPIHCRPTTQLSAATLLTSDWIAPAHYENGPAFDRLARTAKLCRTWADAYGYLLLAAGWADIALDPIMHPWDIAAVVPVVRGAGGVISDWHGGPAYPARSTVAAATPELHAATIVMLADRIPVAGGADPGRTI